jgi:hypothetical protein
MQKEHKKFNNRAVNDFSHFAFTVGGPTIRGPNAIYSISARNIRQSSGLFERHMNVNGENYATNVRAIIKFFKVSLSCCFHTLKRGCNATTNCENKNERTE